jgi:hypothetical protein
LYEFVVRDVQRKHGEAPRVLPLQVLELGLGGGVRGRDSRCLLQAEIIQSSEQRRRPCLSSLAAFRLRSLHVLTRPRTSADLMVGAQFCRLSLSSPGPEELLRRPRRRLWEGPGRQRATRSTCSCAVSNPFDFVLA